MRLASVRFLSIVLLFTVLSVSNSYAALFHKTNYFDKQLLPIEERVPGGIALLPFSYSGKTQPKVTFWNNRVLVQQIGKTEWIAVVGLPLKVKAGKHAALLEQAQGNLELTFEVLDKEYEAQYITLKDNKKVSPSSESLKRISKETKTMKDVFASYSENAPSSLIMSQPAKGPLSSQFGLKRFFNNQPRNPHSGLDIAAEKGSEIRAPLGGKVAAVGDYFFNGNTVLIDHGQGMVSMYCHMETINVSEGQVINTGDLIGKVGSTGRATGPHLHWSMNLNNTRVNPMLFLNKIDQDNTDQEK